MQCVALAMLQICDRSRTFVSQMKAQKEAQKIERLRMRGSMVCDVDDKLVALNWSPLLTKRMTTLIQEDHPEGHGDMAMRQKPQWSMAYKHQKLKTTDWT